MKRLALILLLPAVLLALEPVNLIKDGGFEKDSEVWQTYTGRNDGGPDSAIANHHDAEKALKGGFSGSCDNRTGFYSSVCYDSAIVIQGFCYQKEVSDLDSLTLHYSLAPFQPGSLQGGWIALYIDAGENPYWVAGYVLVREGETPSLPPPMKTLYFFDFPNDTSWHLLTRDIYRDLVDGNISPNSTVDSFLVMGWGAYLPSRRGQKIYWDDIRLMGYADYDVGVKEILSGDSLRQGHPYIPEARIKNFGREPADTFLVIAEIEDSSTIAYIDTVPWSLESDTEDTVTFAEFDPNYGPYTLRVRTVMEPDESDEDDEVSIDMYCSFCEDSPEFPGISMEINNPITKDVLRISYVLPAGQLGIISVYDASGRLHDRVHVRGVSETRIPAALPRGIYFIRLDAGEVSLTRKAVILR